MSDTKPKAAPRTRARTNTTAAKTADDAVGTTNGAAATAAAPTSSDQSDATPKTETGSIPPTGGAEAGDTDTTSAIEAAAAAGAGTAPAPEGSTDTLTEIASEEAARIAEALAPAGGEMTAILSEGQLFAPALPRLLVRALRDGRRRAGRAWPAAGVKVSAEEFTRTQIEQLLADPLLSVTPVADQDSE